MRTINEDDVKRAIRKVKKDWLLCTTKETEKALKVVEGALTGCKTIDAVPVVRCKDCRNRDSHLCPMYHDEFSEVLDEWVCFDETEDDGFCHCGEMYGDADD